MPSDDELSRIFDRIANQQHTDADLEMLRLWLIESRQSIGKYEFNLEQGQNIHMGDRTYMGADADAIPK